MTIAHYGVWACTPTSYEAQTPKQDPKSPHIYLHFTDDSSGYSSKKLEAAINVKSTDKDSRLVFWVTRKFSNSITQQLSELELGFHLASSQSSSNSANKHHSSSHHHERRQNSTLKGLDFIRTQGLLDIKAGQVLPADAPGPNNDILDKLEPIIQDAIKQKATTYIWGSSYGSGIHDIHMNQGSKASFSNGIYEDGALIFKFPDGHWEAVFLAFASQRIPTNDEGEYEENSQSLASILGGDD